MTITSIHNEKLKLVRRLQRRRAREREGLFIAEGEDMLSAARAAGRDPVELLTAAGEGLGGDEVEPELLGRVSTLGSGTRAIGIWEIQLADELKPPCVYLHAVSDPGNVGAVIRSADALTGGTVVLGPDCADPHSPKAVRASMGSLLSRPVARAELGDTPEPRAALVARDGGPLERLEGTKTICIGAEREGLPAQLLAQAGEAVTIPLRPGVDSLNLAAAAAIALQRISSPAEAEVTSV